MDKQKKSFPDKYRALFPLIFLLVFGAAQGQSLTKVNTYGYEWLRGLFTQSLGIPNDTVLLTPYQRAYTHLAKKGATYYEWDVVQQKYVALVMGGGGGGSYTGGFGLVLNGNQFRVDTGLIATKAWLSAYHFTKAQSDARYALLNHTHAGLLPIGGPSGYVLRKNSSADYDVGWYPSDGTALPGSFRFKVDTTTLGVDTTGLLDSIWARVSPNDYNQFITEINNKVEQIEFNEKAFTHVSAITPNYFDLAREDSSIVRVPFPTGPTGGEPDTAEAVVPCGAGTSYNGGPAFPSVITVNLGSGTGLVNFTFNAFGRPDRFVVEYDGVEVINTGYRGNASYQTALNAALTAIGAPTATIQGGGSGTASFIKNSTTTTATLKVYAPMDDTKWTALLSCPGDNIAYVDTIYANATKDTLNYRKGATVYKEAIGGGGGGTSDITTPHTVTYSATPTFNYANSVNQQITLTGNITSMTLSNIPDGKVLYILLKQDATGSRTVTWPSGSLIVGGALTLTTAGNSWDLVGIKRWGSNYLITYGKDFK